MYSLDVTFGDTLTFVLLIGALVVMPGIGALRLLGVRAPTPVVALALGSATGLVLCCSVGFLGARVSWWTIPIVLVPLAVVGWVKRNHRGSRTAWSAWTGPASAGPESADAAFANGDNGYLKQSDVIAAFERAGFQRRIAGAGFPVRGLRLVETVQAFVEQVRHR